MDKTMTEGQPEKGFKIKINGEELFVEKDELTFGEIVKLAFPEGAEYEQAGYRVVFSGGTPRQQEGDLEEGGNLKIKEEMVINVTAYDLS